MYKKSFLQPILLGLIAILFASCDKDFNELGTNIVGDDHFGFELDSLSTVKSYNQKIGPIASNNLAINPLGFYTNPTFGTTQANFVTQVELGSTEPVFNNTDNTLYVNLPVIDSVILDVPYFKTFKKSLDNDVKQYVLDSIYGEIPGTDASKFKLSVYQSNYFLRDLDPSQSLGEQQLFNTDDDNLIDSNKIPILLNDAPTGTLNPDGRENSAFYFDKREHKLTTYKDDGVTPIYTRSVPSMRLHLRTDVFYSKILNAPSSQVASQTAFKNYFRGIYFKAENANGGGNMAMLNFKGGKITIYYKEDKITPDNTTTTANEYKLDRVSKTFALNLTGNSVSLLQNSNENTNYLTAANSTQEASRLYLKGGQGAMTVIDLFGTTDLKGLTRNPNYDSNLPASLTNPKYLLNPAYNPSLPISDSNSKYLNTGPNGVSDEIDEIKANDWLINEANLTFYIDKTAMPESDKKTVEPNRIFLFDLKNKKVLLDYSYDFTTADNYPSRNKYIHGGILLDSKGAIVKQIRDADNGAISNKGTKYKIRITNFVRSLVKNDSTNVRLGLSVTESINSIGFSKLKTPNTFFDSAPSMSVMNQLGTILYGSNIPVTDENYKRRLKLEIYYTKTEQ